MKKNNKHIIFLILLMILSVCIQTTMALIITEPQTIKNRFKPFAFPRNDLIVSKTIEHSYGDTYQVPESLSFDFNINLGESYANSTFETSHGEKSTNELGIMEISLKPGENIYIENIEEETKVTVTELQNKPGFSIKDVSVTKDGTISSDETLIIDYTNIYKAATAKTTNFTLTGTKILEGRDWQENDTFAFTLEYQTSTGEWLPLSTKTITYSEENPDYNKFDFNDIIQALEFDTLGTQNFRLIEVEGDLENITYDKTIKYFNIITSDDEMDGQIDIKEVNGYQNVTITNTDNQYNIDVTFNNTYQETEVADKDISIKVNNTINNTGELTIGPENFEFVLVNKDTNEETKLLTDKNGKVNFGLKYTKDNIGEKFNYTLKETNKGLEGITYDETEYNISVEVTLDENNQIVLKTLVNGIVQSLDNPFVFVNTYHKNNPVIPPEDITLNININKIIEITGDKTIGKENYEFILTNTTTQATEKTKTNSSGKASFLLTYSEKDIDKTYIYKLTEINSGIEGMTYSNKEYTIEVNIKLSEDNKLIATTKVDGKTVTEINTEFTNIYHIEEKPDIQDLQLSIQIENKVDNTGKYSIGPDNFEFILVENQTGKTNTSTTDADGKTNFNLVFTESDIGKTYNYKLSIVKGNIHGLTYSDQLYNISITISLDENYKLVAKILVNGQEVDSVLASFLNTYYIAQEEPALPPTIDLTDNTPYITMMIISAGGLLLIVLHQQQTEPAFIFASATYISNVIPIPEYEEPVLTVPCKQKDEMTSDELYDLITSKRRKKKAAKK